MSEQNILATIGEVVLTDAEVDAFIANMPKEQQMYASHPQFRKQCLDQIISVYLYAKMAEEEKLDETEEFKKIMESARRDVLAQLAIREVMKDVTVSEEDMKAYYEEHKDNYTKGEGVTASHILVMEEDKCNEILAAIKAGEKSFEDAAKEFSTCPSSSKGGDIEVNGEQIQAKFAEATITTTNKLLNEIERRIKRVA